MPIILTKRTRYAYLTVRAMSVTEVQWQVTAELWFAPPGTFLSLRVGELPRREHAATRINRVQWRWPRLMPVRLRHVRGLFSNETRRRFNALRKAHLAQFSEPAPGPWDEFLSVEGYWDTHEHDVTLQERMELVGAQQVANEYGGWDVGMVIHAPPTRLLSYIMGD